MEMIIDSAGGLGWMPFWRLHSIHRPATRAKRAEPLRLLLASVGTCAGIYVVGFCRKRGIAAENIRIAERVSHSESTGMVEKIDLEIQVPPGFPEKYRESIIHAAALRAVKKHPENPPLFNITTATTKPRSLQEK